MRRFKCTVAYIGNHYDGWQSQKNGKSVQEQIEEAIAFVTKERTPIIAAGRTDAGVSANGQVFMFDSDMDLSAYKWMGVLNKRLPDDIHIKSIEEVNERFHARYNVRYKRYDYRIHLGDYDVFSKDYAYQCPFPLHVEEMEKASKYLIGYHDFTSFNANDFEEYPDQSRKVMDIQFEQEGDILKISFIGKGFLRYMVRMMVGQLIEVGRGKKDATSIKEMLEEKSKTATNRNARPEGLTLEYIDYFEIIAINEEGMIREFIDGDELPNNWTLDHLEKAVKHNEVEQYYIFTTRNTQQQLGTLYVNTNDKKIILYIKDDEDVRWIATTLQAQIQSYYPDFAYETSIIINNKERG